MEDHLDGTNIHNWHWSENNCLDWFKTFFSNLPILGSEGNLFLKMTSLHALKGEAYVNASKGKIVSGYKFPQVFNVSDENANEDPKVKVIVNYEELSMAKGDPIKDEWEPKKVSSLMSLVATMTRATTTKVNAPLKENSTRKKEKEKEKKARKSISMIDRFNC
ncbi:Activator heat shock protein ATPase 1 [Glycine soja]